MTATATETWVIVAAADAVPDGEVRTFEVDGERIAVARAAGTVYAVEDLCSHDDGPLGSGCLDGHAVQCPRHGAKFDVRTGAVVAMPAIAPIQAFPAKEQDGQILVALPSRADDTAGDDW